MLADRKFLTNDTNREGLVISDERTVLLVDHPDVEVLQFAPDDAHELFKLIDRNRQHLSQMGDKTAGKYPTYESVLESINNPPNPNKLRLGIWWRRIMVGTINLTPMKEEVAEIGYWVGTEFNGRGFATLALQAMVHHAFQERRAHYLVAQTHPDNRASQRVLMKAGFKLEFACGKGWWSWGRGP